MARKQKQSSPAPEQVVAPEPTPAATLVVEPKVTVERLRKSSVENPVAQVWIMSHNACSAAVAAGQPVPSRKSLVNSAIAAGIAYYTARTQVQAYLKASQNGTAAPTKLPRNVALVS